MFHTSRGSWTMLPPDGAERPLGQQTHQVVALDELAPLVEEEAAVEVAVPGDAQVGALSHHRFGGNRPVLGQQRVGHPMWERCHRGVVDLDELEGADDLSSMSMTGPAPPLPALTTTFSGRSRVTST